MELGDDSWASALTPTPLPKGEGLYLPLPFNSLSPLRGEGRGEGGWS